MGRDMNVEQAQIRPKDLNDDVGFMEGTVQNLLALAGNQQKLVGISDTSNWASSGYKAET
jgi:hypothetical protein